MRQVNTLQLIALWYRAIIQHGANVPNWSGVNGVLNGLIDQAEADG